MNAMDLCHGITMAVDAVVTNLKSRARMISTIEEIAQEWTLYEILRYALQHNWTAYEEALKTNPLLAKMVINGVVYSLGGLDCAKHFGCG
ncbi:uncharacterized protein LOC122091219 isoform X4 [Macadamia integrifolia]|uniref:uncharacterized protein LOC122091219 isoform X4 n=1 Tax=Macadamia integrifolia TaxID=60698 RepID=UPI001C4F9ECA|nr:uncharacterized protein LOC122091219 isoform X4 [Macadamia integrifolia]